VDEREWHGKRCRRRLGSFRRATLGKLDRWVHQRSATTVMADGGRAAAHPRKDMW
jgi:hypothetical protein